VRLLGDSRILHRERPGILADWPFIRWHRWRVCASAAASLVGCAAAISTFCEEAGSASICCKFPGRVMWALAVRCQRFDGPHAASSARGMYVARCGLPAPQAPRVFLSAWLGQAAGC
jgi:hypothetical protein